jgi:pyruvyltransferase
MNYIKLFWFNNLNFGDMLNYWLIKRMAKKEIIYVTEPCNEPHYIAIGSILNWATTQSIVWGAGLASLSDSVNPDCELLAVRGPISGKIAEQNGNVDPKVYGDPALLVPLHYTKKVEKKHKIGVIPHYVDMQYILDCEIHQDIKIINVMDNVETILDDILSCERIISSSLHGLIVADAYGIPNLHCKFTHLIGGDGMKYTDHFLSVQVEPYEPLSMWQLAYMQNVDFLESIIIDRKPIIDTQSLIESCPFLEG